MKKNIVFWICVVFVIMLVGCGGNDESSASSSAAQPNETATEAPAVSAGDPVAGEAKYNEVCIACHGAEGVGIEGLGKPFVTSEFVRTTSDEDLLTFVKTGRPTSDPANTTGVDMPPKGGNPALTDDQILDIIAYIRTLQQ